MTTKTRNEAAERLLSDWVVSGELPPPPKGGWTIPRLVGYLEAEIRQGVWDRVNVILDEHVIHEAPDKWLALRLAIFDEEAAR